MILILLRGAIKVTMESFLYPILVILMDLCNDPYAMYTVYLIAFFYFVCHKILGSDLSLSGSLAVGFFR